MDATAILLANLAEIYDQLRRLRDTAGLTEDETRAVDELLAEIDELPSDRLVNIDDIEYLASAASRLKLTLETRAARRRTEGRVDRPVGRGSGACGDRPARALARGRKQGRRDRPRGQSCVPAAAFRRYQHAVYSARLGRGVSETA